MQHKHAFIILDFGSQFTQLIARRLREMNVFSEIYPFDLPISEIKSKEPAGIILSGGPSSVKEIDAPRRDVKALIDIAPVLGICYGMQLLAEQLGGVVVESGHREYGLKDVVWSEVFAGIPQRQSVWMSHGDVVEVAPPGFVIHGRSVTGAAAAMRSDRAWGFQFHPEVTHTQHGDELLKSFVFGVCKARATWDTEHIAQEIIDDLKQKIPAGEKILCALSGGVDSTVVGVLLTRALGAGRVKCVFVNNGVLRKNEYSEVLEIYRRLGLNITGVDAAAKFLTELKDVDDPETKRKIIGRVFLEVFESEIERDVSKNQLQWLAQGTLYPDVIESVNLRGASVTIKTHHNVGGLPQNMKLKLVEPLRELFKDEVRKLGGQLGIPQDILWRHPFPGPGLAIRIIGAVDDEKLRILRDVDAIYIDELKKNGLYDKIWQAFSVLLPIKSVGVQGDSRSYERVVALRAVVSHDGMTADWFEFPTQFLRHVSNRITNEVREVNRVVYDITSKPPGTIEWE